MHIRLAVAALAIIVLTGCSTRSAAEQAKTVTVATTPVPVVGSIGQPVAFTDQIATPPAKGTVTVNSAHRVTAAADDPYATYGSYLVLDVTVAATAGEIPTDPSEFEAQGKSGHSYTATFTDNQTLSGTARPGVPSRGDVALSAPAGDGPFRVVWSYGGMAGSTARAEFNVSG